MILNDLDAGPDGRLPVSSVLRGPDTFEVTPFQSLLTQPRSVPNNQDSKGKNSSLPQQSALLNPAQYPDGARIAELEGEVFQLKEQMLHQAEEFKKKAQDLVATARAEALASFKHDDAARTEALLRAVDEALAQQVQHLERLESGAIRIAKAALDPVFGEAFEVSSLVMAMIANQVQLLQERSVVEIRVSLDDKLNLAALAAMLEAKSHPDSIVVADPSLPKGAVRIDMRLGHIRLDLTDYAKSVHETLQEMAWANDDALHKEKAAK